MPVGNKKLAVTVPAPVEVAAAVVEVKTSNELLSIELTSKFEPLVKIYYHQQLLPLK